MAGIVPFHIPCLSDRSLDPFGCSRSPAEVPQLSCHWGVQPFSGEASACVLGRLGRVFNFAQSPIEACCCDPAPSVTFPDQSDGSCCMAAGATCASEDAPTTWAAAITASGMESVGKASGATCWQEENSAGGARGACLGNRNKSCQRIYHKPHTGLRGQPKGPSWS